MIQGESQMNRSNRQKRGFTLIELMLVVVILAVLASLIVPKFTGQSKKAKVIAAKSDISTLELAIDTFEIHMGRYPTNSEGIRALIEEPSNAEDWDGPYLKRGVPKDPWGNEYVYKQPGQHNEHGYDLYSFGPDMVQSTEDDIKNWSEDQ